MTWLRRCWMLQGFWKSLESALVVSRGTGIRCSGEHASNTSLSGGNVIVALTRSLEYISHFVLSNFHCLAGENAKLAESSFKLGSGNFGLWWRWDICLHQGWSFCSGGMQPLTFQRKAQWVQVVQRCTQALYLYVINCNLLISVSLVFYNVMS